MSCRVKGPKEFNDKVYKVVRVVDEKHGIYESSHAKNFAKVTYEVGRETRAPEFMLSKGYGLTVFLTTARCKEFINNQPNRAGLKILQCEPLGEIAFADHPQRLDPNSINNGKFVRKAGNENWPAGTALVSAVKVISVL